MSDYRCNRCSHIVPENSRVLHDIRCPLISKSQLITCELCNQSFMFYEIAEHKEGCRLKVCEFCGQFMSVMELQGHEQVCPELVKILSQKEELQECHICQQRMEFSLLKDHQLAHQFESLTVGTQSPVAEAPTSEFSESSSSEEDCPDSFPDFLTIICSNNEKEECNICLDPMKKKQRLKMLPCMHKFHVKCLNDWLSRLQQCPICQTDL